MPTDDTLDSSLRAVLPAALHDAVLPLMMLFGQVVDRTLDPDEAQRRLTGTPSVEKLLQALAGREIATERALLSFGQGNELGTVSVGDVAGRDVVKLRVALNAPMVQQTIEVQDHSSASWITQIAQQNNYYYGLAEPPSVSPPVLNNLTPVPASDSRAAQRRPNPFGRTGRLSDPTEFFGREDLLRQLFEALGQGRNRALVGDTQMGKSSLLAMVCKLGPARFGLPADRFVYLDMQTIYDEGDFFEALCDKLGIAPACRGYKLARALRNTRAILCLDEIEKMTRARFSGDERTELRGLADGDDTPLTLLIASRQPLDTLFPDTPGATSPLANICQTLDVPLFTPAEIRAFVAHRLHGTGIDFNEPEVETLVMQSGGHPAKLQQLAAALFARKQGV